MRFPPRLACKVTYFSKFHNEFSPKSTLLTLNRLKQDTTVSIYKEK